MQLAWLYTISCSDATCLAMGLIMCAQEVGGLKCLGAGEVGGDLVLCGPRHESQCCWCCADAASLSFASCTGVREKKVAFIGVKVYSVALFVDQAGASAALKSGESLLTGEFEKLLSIKLAMKVGG